MQVRIFRPSKNAMQSGRGGMGAWRVEPVLETARIPEPLMGWTSSADTLGQLRLTFSNPEDAVKFSEKMGWSYSIDEPHERKVVPRSYGDRFSPRQKA